MVRYADDAVLGFQHRYEAERFLERLRERLGKFGLELNSKKTRKRPHGSVRGVPGNRHPYRDPDPGGPASPISFTSFGWQKHCRGLYQTPIAA